MKTTKIITLPNTEVKVYTENGKQIIEYIPNETIEPDFINSLGEKFYISDNTTVYYVYKETNEIRSDKIIDISTENMRECSVHTEIMSKESAEKWIRDNRQFEHEAYYTASLNGRDTVIQYSKHDNCFYQFSNEYDTYKKEDFDSIGDKIKF